MCLIEIRRKTRAKYAYKIFYRQEDKTLIGWGRYRCWTNDKEEYAIGRTYKSVPFRQRAFDVRKKVASIYKKTGAFHSMVNKGNAIALARLYRGLIVIKVLMIQPFGVGPAGFFDGTNKEMVIHHGMKLLEVVYGPTNSGGK